MIKTMGDMFGYKIPHTNRKKKCKFKGCGKILNGYQAAISDYCCNHEKIINLRRMDEMVEKMSKKRKKENRNCSTCACYFLNQEEGSEVYNLMEEAQIECSNEQPEIFTHNEKGTCPCWQKIEKLINNPFKSGDKVRYKNGDKRIFRVHTIYSDTYVSLGLADYPDTEQDFQINIKEIKRVKEK